jgi:hypothetical protein
MEIKIKLDDNSLTSTHDIKIELSKFQKMLLLYNALEEGWAIKKNQDAFIFSKNHEGKREVILDSYLLKFMKNNMDLNKILS